MFKAKYCALFAVIAVLCVSGEALAYKINHYREGENVRAEAARRKINLIPIAQAQAIAAGQAGSENVSFPMIELADTAGRTSASSDYRPVYKLECVSSGRSCYVVVDAVTGRVLSSN